MCRTAAAEKVDLNPFQILICAKSEEVCILNKCETDLMVGVIYVPRRKEIILRQFFLNHREGVIERVILAYASIYLK